jgi:hypothetical protein
LPPKQQKGIMKYVQSKIESYFRNMRELPKTPKKESAAKDHFVPTVKRTQLKEISGQTPRKCASRKIIDSAATPNDQQNKQGGFTRFINKLNAEKTDGENIPGNIYNEDVPRNDGSKLRNRTSNTRLKVSDGKIANRLSNDSLDVDSGDSLIAECISDDSMTIRKSPKLLNKKPSIAESWSSRESMDPILKSISSKPEIGSDDESALELPLINAVAPLSTSINKASQHQKGFQNTQERYLEDNYTILAEKKKGLGQDNSMAPHAKRSKVSGKGSEEKDILATNRHDLHITQTSDRYEDKTPRVNHIKSKNMSPPFEDHLEITRKSPSQHLQHAQTIKKSEQNYLDNLYSLPDTSMLSDDEMLVDPKRILVFDDDSEDEDFIVDIKSAKISKSTNSILDTPMQKRSARTKHFVGATPAPTDFSRDFADIQKHLKTAKKNKLRTEKYKQLDEAIKNESEATQMNIDQETLAKFGLDVKVVEDSKKAIVDSIKFLKPGWQFEPDFESWVTSGDQRTVYLCELIRNNAFRNFMALGHLRNWANKGWRPESEFILQLIIYGIYF